MTGCQFVLHDAAVFDQAAQADGGGIWRDRQPDAEGAFVYTGGRYLADQASGIWCL